jgi:putative salt-induced outer membrane protein YdiY
MDVRRSTLAGGVLLAVCGGVHCGVAAEQENQLAETGWRPAAGSAEDAIGSRETLLNGVAQRPVRAEGRYSVLAVPATWRSLVQEAGQAAKVWTKRVEVGAKVLKGNTDQDFVRIAAEMLKENDDSVHQVDLGGRFGQVNGQRNTNRWYLDSTVDHSQPGNWLLYFSGKHEYNEFQGVDYRGTGSFGVGYRFVEETDRHILVRLGPAVTMEVYSGAGGHRVTPDFFAEYEIDWPLFERTRLETKTTMRPSLSSLEVFRFRNNTAVLVPLDDEERWSLKLGFRLDYNSVPKTTSNRVPMDVTTDVSIVYMRP